MQKPKLYTVRYDAYQGESQRDVTPRNVGKVVNQFLRKAEPGMGVTVYVQEQPA